MNNLSCPRKKGLDVENPDGIQILKWLAHIAGYRILPLKPERRDIQSPIQLLDVTPSDWQDIYLASQYSNALADFKPMDVTTERIQNETGLILDAAIPFDTGLSVGRKAVLFRMKSKIMLSFEATKPDEMKMNAWSHAKDKGWSLPYARYWEGRQVHSFFLDMWLGMKDEVLKNLTRTIVGAEKEGEDPDRILITGHSMGGGISVLAVMDIVEHLRQTFGTPSPSPRPWCTDQNLTHLIRHVTFTEFAASGSDFNSHLNEFYERYQIPAWDFVHPHDFTTRLHLPFFRSWRGHRYVLPKEAVKPFDVEFAAGRHDMPGYMKSMEWMKTHPQTLRSLYAYT